MFIVVSFICLIQIKKITKKKKKKKHSTLVYQVDQTIKSSNTDIQHQAK
ncbi:hypothetical protein HanPI659440_Chr01g0031261 [Helianthus annuus]|nr:hypothetical protein HanPI659440_Chr01g0031261 [Helianthus annuus]